jgi:hypothetical protein
MFRRKLIATQTFSYRAGSLMLRPGDRFIAASDEDARLLIGWGKAIDDPVGTPPKEASDQRLADEQDRRSETRAQRRAREKAESS